MPGFPQAFDDLNKSGVDFLLTDIDVAMTLMDIADASPIQDTVARNRKKAHEAYDAVVQLTEKLTPDAGQRRMIAVRLAPFESSLAGRWASVRGVRRGRLQKRQRYSG